jgi:hypothetical protein
VLLILSLNFKLDSIDELVDLGFNEVVDLLLFCCIECIEVNLSTELLYLAICLLLMLKLEFEH